MGNNHSHSITSLLSYSDAVASISTEEFQHLQSSYHKLLLPPNKDNFVKHVMIGFPAKFSEKLYSVFGGTAKGLLFEHLLCGLVLLLRGSPHDKTMLLFQTLSSDCVKITRTELETALLEWGVEVPEEIEMLFTISDTCNFTHFNKWVVKFTNKLGVFNWLYKNENIGFVCSGKKMFMTYHQFLSEQASFTEMQVMSLEKHYNRLRKSFSSTKKFDLDTLYGCLHPIYSYDFAQHFFLAFDLNKDGNIDPRELTIGLSAILEGGEQFYKFVFSMFDQDEDEQLNETELSDFANVLNNFCMLGCEKYKTPAQAMDCAEFSVWCDNSCSMYKFHSHLRCIAYIVFAVRPDLTFSIIRQWMEMEGEMKLITGKEYYIANNEWFKGMGGPVDNTAILEPELNGAVNGKKVPVITTEGGSLRKGLLHGVDYLITSQVLWYTLECWYGCDAPICRKARLTPGGAVIIELFPIKLNFYRQPQTSSQSALEVLSNGFQTINIKNSLEGSNYEIPKSILSYYGAFYCDDTLGFLVKFLSEKLRLGIEDLRLWRMKKENTSMLLLEEGEDKTLDMLNIKSGTSLLIEIRNFDMSWPEEVSSIINQNRILDRRQPTARVTGTTGLNNLGNTCFMNSAIQCLSNTRPLTCYFLKELHMHELSRDNPDSLNGLLALRYADLVKALWSGTSRTIAPLKMRWTIAKFASQFNGFGQHDAQELLAFLLDGLHEDLNRVTVKPYTPVNDSGSRLDSAVAEEFWSNHAARNQSVIVDLFHGQLKSTLRCLTCGFTSVRFDPFSSLSLPLPENENVIIEVFVIPLNPASNIVKYCIWLNSENTVRIVIKRLKERIALSQVLLTDVVNSVLRKIINLDDPLNSIKFPLYAFELPHGADPADFVIVYNRHYVTVDKYFIEFQRRQVLMFGTPFIISTKCSKGQNRKQEITERIRDHLIEKYSLCDYVEAVDFTVKHVTQIGVHCATCPWESLCHGCQLSDEIEFGNTFLAVDWAPAVVHLIRQYDDDLNIIEDGSVAEAKKRQSQPVDLSTCLDSFTKEEQLGEEWYCKRCEEHRASSKKLDIWRLPPVLIIHLKRFSYQGGKWVKCQRRVKFPDSFDPSPFLVESSMISLKARMRTESMSSGLPRPTILVEREDDDYDEVSVKSHDDDEVNNPNNCNPLAQVTDSLGYIINSMNTPINNSSSSAPFNENRPYYDLYAVTSHSGMIGHGHYTSFAMNPNRGWYYYNDSQVKKTTKTRVLSEPAYMLFYERRNLKLNDLLPTFIDTDDYTFDFDASVIMKETLYAAQDADKKCNVM